MKAIVVRRFGPVEEADYCDHPDPSPGPGEVVIDVEAAETNYPDILVIEGRYQVRPTLPFVPGKAAAGTVSAVGAGVTDLSPGRRVAVQVEYGAYAERLLARADACYPIPDGVDAVTAAAAVLTYQTAWFALTDRAVLRRGESVLVLGASGGVGVASLQLARALGAGTVIAGSRGAAKADVLRRAGADSVVDLSRPNLRDALREDVRRLTDGQGADVVIDPVGGDAFEPALRAMAWRGRLVVVGFAGGDIPTVRANYLLVRNVSVCGLQASDYRDRRPGEAAAAQAEIFGMIARGEFKPVVSDVLPLAGFAAALSRLKAGKAEGKIVLSTREVGA